MWCMSTKPPAVQPRLYVRYSPAARHALKTALAALQSPDLLGEKLTQEDLICATWLWVASLDPAEVAPALAPHVAAVHGWREKQGKEPRAAKAAAKKHLFNPQAPAAPKADRGRKRG